MARTDRCMHHEHDERIAFRVACNLRRFAGDRTDDRAFLRNVVVLADGVGFGHRMPPVVFMLFLAV